MRQYLIVLMLSVCTFTTWSQDSFQRVSDTIPYRLIKQKIVFPVKLKDTTVNFILDTGGQTGIMHCCVPKTGTKMVGGSRIVGDYGGNRLGYGEGELADILLGDNYRIAKQKVMVFPSNPFFLSLDVVGIISGDALKECVLTIDAQKSILVINYPYRPHRLKIEDGLEMHPGDVEHPIFQNSYGGIEVNALFDSGAHGFFMLSENDYKNFKTGTYKDIDSGHGINGVGIGGIGKPMNLKKVLINEINFAGKIFKNVETIVELEGISIFGLDMTKYGKIIIDYMRDRFYYLPYDDRIVENVGLGKRWNVSILPSDKGFEVTSVWNGVAVKFGEKIVNINGKDLKDVEQNQLVIESIMEAISEDTAYIIVEDEKKEQRKVEIRRK